MKSAVSYEINSTTSTCVYVFSLVACIIVLVDTVWPFQLASPIDISCVGRYQCMMIYTCACESSCE